MVGLATFLSLSISTMLLCCGWRHGAQQMRAVDMKVTSDKESSVSDVREAQRGTGRSSNNVVVV